MSFEQEGDPPQPWHALAPRAIATGLGLNGLDGLTSLKWVVLGNGEVRGWQELARLSSKRSRWSAAMAWDLLSSQVS